MAIAVNDLVEKISKVVDDTSYSPVFIINQMNAGFREIAGRVLLRDLETIGSLTSTAGVNYTALPADYHRNLSRWAYSTTQSKRLYVYKSLSRLFMQFDDHDEAGAIIGLARNGTNIFYQKVPAAEEAFKIMYFAYPTAAAADGNFPAGLPEHLVEPLMISYAAWKIYEQWEDGIEGEKVNTTYHATIYEKTLNDLRVYLGYPAEDGRGVIE